MFDNCYIAFPRLSDPIYTEYQTISNRTEISTVPPVYTWETNLIGTVWPYSYSVNMALKLWTMVREHQLCIQFMRSSLRFSKVLSCQQNAVMNVELHAKIITKAISTFVTCESRSRVFTIVIVFTFATYSQAVNNEKQCWVTASSDSDSLYKTCTMTSTCRDLALLRMGFESIVA